MSCVNACSYLLIMSTSQCYCTRWAMDVLSDPPTHHSSRAGIDWRQQCYSGV